MTHLPGRLSHSWVLCCTPVRVWPKQHSPEFGFSFSFLLQNLNFFSIFNLFTSEGAFTKSMSTTFSYRLSEWCPITLEDSGWLRLAHNSTIENDWKWKTSINVIYWILNILSFRKIVLHVTWGEYLRKSNKIFLTHGMLSMEYLEKGMK